MGTLIIAEAGSNWKAKQPLGYKLIDLAVEAGADAVKFQVFRGKTVYAAGSNRAAYLARMGINRPIHDIFSDLEMPYPMVEELASYASENGILFMASFFSEDDFAVVDPHVSVHKIASYELHHPRLLECVAKTGKPLILSTGISTLEEVTWAVETFRSAGGGDLTLLQCTAQYPAAPEGVHLNALETLRDRFGVKVGLSDHTADPVVAPVAAVALGASVIEKHFTIDKGLEGPDHCWALDGPELKEMVRAIRLTETMLGEPEKAIAPQEKELRSFCRRSVQALCPIKAGEVLREGENIGILRPGQQPQGAHPRYLSQIEGMSVKNNLEAGEGVTLDDINPLS